LCTLLGPEGPGPTLVGNGNFGPSAGTSLEVLVTVFRTLVSTVLMVGGGYRPYFENYTVDASILDNTVWCCHIHLVIGVNRSISKRPIVF